ncbi:hypothetical protein [Rhodovibrio salinarum]|nr:hypothetical protein [Rhodovibrio salinarum]
MPFEPAAHRRNTLVKMSVNYLHSETDEPGGQDETVDTGLLRLQLTL